MTVFLTFTVLGLVLGAVYAIAASGLVLTYTTSGIFNFAHGAQAMIGAFLYWQLVYAWSWPQWLALVFVLGVVGPGMGAILYTLIMRGLHNTADVTKIVVTVAVMLGFVSLSQWVWHPEDARILQPFFGSGTTVDIGGVVIRAHEILCLVIAILLAVGLRVLFTRTRVGVAMRGVVDDPDLLRLNGHNPERIALLSWAGGSTLAVLAGLLITPIGGGALQATALTLLVIDAFAAAMFGRLRSIPRTFLGAVVLGLSGTYLVAYAPAQWSWVSNFRVSLPMIFLFIVLLVLPQDRLRGAAVRTRERYHVPSVRKACIWGLVLVTVVTLLQPLMVDSAVSTLALGMAFAVIALSLTLLTGYAGEINLAPLSLGALGTIIVFHFGIQGTGLAARTTWWGVLLGVAFAAVVGGLVALPALRLRGLYLALATMAFGVLVSNMVLRDTVEHRVLGVSFSIFPTGSLIIPPLQIGPLDLRDGRVLLTFVTVLFAVLAVAVIALRNSGYGRRLAALKDSPAASATLGQNLVKLKLTVFMMSSAVAGLGGIIMSSAIGSVAAENFTIFGSLALVLLTVVAGIGYVSGALFGGLVAGVGFTIIVGTFSDLAVAQPGMANIYSILANVAVVGTALIGIGVGRNPSGIVHDVLKGYRTLSRATPVLWGALAFEAALYGLTLAGVVGNWQFAIVTVLLGFLLPLIGRTLMPRRVLDEEQLAARDETPPELVGVTGPWTDEQRQDVDRRLGIADSLPAARRDRGASREVDTHAVA